MLIKYPIYPINNNKIKMKNKIKMIYIIKNMHTLINLKKKLKPNLKDFFSNKYTKISKLIKLNIKETIQHIPIIKKKNKLKLKPYLKRFKNYKWFQWDDYKIHKLKKSNFITKKANKKVNENLFFNVAFNKAYNKSKIKNFPKIKFNYKKTKKTKIQNKIFYTEKNYINLYKNILQKKFKFLVKKKFNKKLIFFILKTKLNNLNLKIKIYNYQIINLNKKNNLQIYKNNYNQYPFFKKKSLWFKYLKIFGHKAANFAHKFIYLKKYYTLLPLFNIYKISLLHKKKKFLIILKKNNWKNNISKQEYITFQFKHRQFKEGTRNTQNFINKFIYYYINPNRKVRFYFTALSIKKKNYTKHLKLLNKYKYLMLRYKQKISKNLGLIGNRVARNTSYLKINIYKRFFNKFFLIKNINYTKQIIKKLHGRYSFFISNIQFKLNYFEQKIFILLYRLQFVIDIQCSILLINSGYCFIDTDQIYNYKQQLKQKIFLTIKQNLRNSILYKQTMEYITNYLPRFFKIELFDTLMFQLKITFNKFLQNFTRKKNIKTIENFEIDDLEKIYNFNRAYLKNNFLTKNECFLKNKKYINYNYLKIYNLKKTKLKAKWQLIIYKLHLQKYKTTKIIKNILFNILKYNGEYINNNMLINLKNHFMQRINLIYRLDFFFENNLINKELYNWIFLLI